MRRKLLILALAMSILLNVSLMLYLFDLKIKDTRPIAIVNNEGISRESFYKKLEQRYGNEVIKDLIAEKLIVQEGKRRHISVPKRVIDSEIKSITRFYSSESDFRKSLKARFMTIDDVRTQVRLQLLAEQLVSVPQPTDQELRAFYDTSKNNLLKGINYEKDRSKVLELYYLEKRKYLVPELIRQLMSKAKIKQNLPE